MKKEHFCACPRLECRLNPNGPECRSRHCDGCIAQNLKDRMLPACFFLAVCDDLSECPDWTFRGFADWVYRHENPDGTHTRQRP